MSAQRRRPMNWSGSVLVTLLFGGAAYAAILALLWVAQERLLFMPTVLSTDEPLARWPDVHETWIDVPGARLSALHLRLPDPKGVVFFLHGNGGSLQNWFVDPDYYRRLNVDLFMIDYRGYGKSSGRIESQQQLMADVHAAWNTIAPRYAGRKLVLYGRSLGSGLAAQLAVDLAASRPPDLTVLVSPYTSMVDLTRTHYPWVPTALLRYPLRTDLLVAQIPGRLMLIHGESDQLITPRHSTQLHAQVPQAQLLLVPGAGHNDLQEFPRYLDGLASELARL